MTTIVQAPDLLGPGHPGTRQSPRGLSQHRGAGEGPRNHGIHLHILLSRGRARKGTGLLCGFLGFLFLLSLEPVHVGLEQVADKSPRGLSQHRGAGEGPRNPVPAPAQPLPVAPPAKPLPVTAPVSCLLQLLFKCSECDQILKTKRNLENHVVTKHRTCKECKIVIESKDELDQHKKEHTTCKVCRGDFKIKSKLERHMKTHQ